MEACLESRCHKIWSISCSAWNLCIVMGLINCLSLAAVNVNSHINVVLLKFDCGSGYIKNLVTKMFHSFILSFHWCVQDMMIPCHSQELLPFLSVTYFFLPLFSTNYSSILSHLILPSISWSTSQSCCSQLHI